MNPSFSALRRPAYIQTFQQTPLDLLVVGGGITGAGIALDARSRGLHVGLVEMQDFAAGTSSRSTKLVHGGLRYLKQLELKLVAEVGRERAIVHANAPHVTHPVPMLLPLTRGGSLRKWEAALALSVYDFLAGVKPAERRRMLSAAATLKQEPLLDPDGLLGGALYYEYRTDDARLTLEILKEAVHRGALALNYAKVTGFLYENGKISGATVTDELTGESFPVRARQVVNAAGPWVDAVDTLNDPAEGGKLFLTKGVHLVVDGARLPVRQAAYFDTPDGRMMFAIPREGKTYLGTTDTPYAGSTAHPDVTAGDVTYLLDAVNRTFPGVHLQPADVESTWAGLRPLIRQKGKGPGEISRKDEIFRYDSGLLSIAGGKLTGYRKMAERIVDLVAGRLRKATGQSFGPCITARLRLSGGDLGGDTLEGFVREKTRQGELLGLSPAEAERLSRLYGANVDKVYAYLPAVTKDSHLYGLPPTLLAQLQYGIDAEMVARPADFFIRRTGALYFNVHWVRQYAEPVWVYMQSQLQWPHAEAQAYRRELNDLLGGVSVNDELRMTN
jgi:glycerol-3-phosphate dehydrogenase